MNRRKLTTELTAFRTKLDELQHQHDALPVELRHVLDETLSELNLKLEELQTAQEDLREQGEELEAVSEAVEEERRRYRGLFELAPDAYLVTDLSGVIQEANASSERLFGMRRARLVGMSLKLFLPVEDRPMFGVLLDDLVRLRDPPRPVLRLAPEDQRPSEVEATVGPVRDAAGRASGLCWILRDVSPQRRLERDLREREALLRAVLDNTADAVCLKDREGRLLLANPAMLRLIGKSGEAVMGKSVVEYGDDPAAARGLMENDRRVIAQGVPETTEETLRTAQGARVFLSTKTPWRDAAGEIIGLISVSRDITDHKRAEEDVRRNQAILVQAGDLAHLGAWDIELLDPGNINDNPLRWSDEVYRIFGYEPGSVEATSDLFFRHVHPDDRQPVADAVTRALAERVAYEVEHRIIRADGIERTVVEHAEIISDASGRPLRMIGAVQDITERRQADEALRRSEERFRSLAESMPAVVWTADAAGAVDYLNSRWEQYTGLSRDASSGWNWRRIIHPDDAARTEQTWRKAVETGSAYEIEYRWRRADGEYRWFLGQGYPIHDEEGRVIKWVGTGTDIHDLKMVQEKLARSNRDLEQFAYVASHDLQEPLRMVTGYMGLLQAECGARLSAAENEYIGYAVEGAQRMQQLIRDLLAYARVGQERPLVRTAMGRVLDEALADHQSSIDEARAVITRDPMVTVYGDAAQLRQLMSNLIGNALKYRKPAEPPRIHIGVDRPNGFWRFFVQDNGIGMDPRYAERIFRVFQRLHTRREYPGTGMGLAICKKIVERHGGRIWVESAPGKGSTFFFTLPDREGPS